MNKKPTFSSSKKREAPDYLRWSQLLHEAVNNPGAISKAYSAFYGYSLGNRLAAYSQCLVSGIEAGPLDTFNGWKEKGRSVKKGERALFLCMPKNGKGKKEVRKEDGSVEVEEHSFRRFFWVPRWFVLSQTEGEDFKSEPIDSWDRNEALKVLNISEESFTSMNGNCLGYAYKRTIAINPLGDMPHKTTFHECAHILLGHTEENNMSDNEQIPRNLKEVEAEAVALICSESLGLSGQEYSRGYIQNWYCGDVIPERNAQRIFKVADQILKAGLTGKEVIV